MQILTPLETPPPVTPAGSPTELMVHKPSASSATSITARAAAAIAGKVFLPDGTPLLMSISRKVVLGALFDVEEVTESGETRTIPWPGPSTPMEDLVVLFLCATVPDLWYQPSVRADGAVVMLYQNNAAFMTAVMEWADASCVKDMGLGELYPIVKALWTGAHANFVTPLAEKKTHSQPLTAESPPTGASSIPLSSPEETPASSPSSSTISPSTTPTGKSTRTSTPPASNASPRRKGRAVPKKPTA